MMICSRKCSVIGGDILTRAALYFNYQGGYKISSLFFAIVVEKLNVYVMITTCNTRQQMIILTA